MFRKIFNDVVQLALASTPQELEQALAPMPHGVRYGVVCDLEDTGIAHRYDSARERAYYLKSLDHGVLVWRWNFIASYEEAGKLLALAVRYSDRLSGEVANRIFSKATRRPIELPVPALETRAICAI